jgi:MarR family transcriptional regulator, organic hydroperoxide resistance regulator
LGAIGRALRQAIKAYNSVLQEELAPYGVGVAEFLHLRSLWSQDGVSQIELAQELGIERASCAEVLSSLEEKELIFRRRSSEDRRRVDIFVSPKGDGLKRTVLPAGRRVALKAVDGFSETEIGLLTRMLGRMTVNLRGSSGTD